MESLRLSQPRIVPDGWNQDALKHFAPRWQTIHTRDGKDHRPKTQYTLPFVAKIKPDSSDLAEELTAYWGEVTDPADAIVRREVVVFQPPVDQPAQVRDSLTKTVLKASNRVHLVHSMRDGNRLLTKSCKHFSRQLGKNQLQSCKLGTAQARRKSSCNC